MTLTGEVDIRLLGPVSVAVDGRDVPIGSPKQRIILAMLALSGRASAGSLVDALWRETPPASVAATVHTLVSRLRRNLEGAGARLAIRAEAGGYVLDLDRDRLDVARFHALAADGRSALVGGDPERAARCFRDALDLWRGPALADLADRDFARIAAVRLDGARLDVAEELAAAELAARRPAAALDVVEPLIPEHPFRERLRARQMIALYRLGRQAEALAAYQDLRRTLADELGLEPTSDLQTLERQILRQSPELDVRAPVAAGPPSDPGESRPGGTLAFLFTDIEASTRRWEGDRTAMAADLARHDAILRDAVAAHGGSLFTHTGDGLGAAFATVPDALAAAIAGQRELGGVTWSGPGPLRVRMAVHAGTAEARAGTYLGPTLNRTARLLGEAGGGQILCSQSAADLVRDDLPDGAMLLDFGERALEGFSRPERVWRVAHPDLPESPPPPTVETRPSGPLTSFVGREEELAELAALLPQTRLLTITGVGGAGKTRLALELAARMEKLYEDGARVVELASVRDDRPLAGDVLAALGVDTGPGSGLAADEQLCRVLSTRRILLVLDNCEHVLEPVDVLVGTVLRRCPHVTIVATSREVLSVAGETTWSTPGLSLPPAGAGAPEDLEGSDAASLFVVRARTAQPGFGAVPANAAAIARICRRLDGIPLALELAAARVRVLSVPQLADRLDDRLRLLTSGPRSAPARHQTLRATMDWSFELLGAAEQQLLRRLAVFPQNFDLDAAAAVAGDGADPIDVLDLLARLVDKSLVVPEGAAETARYRLLETVRQYAAEKLAGAGEEEETRARHRRHFVERIRTGYRSGAHFFGIEWSRFTAPDSENYGGALTSAVADGDWESATVILAGVGQYSWYWGLPVPSAVEAIDVEELRCSEPSLHVEALLSLGAGKVIIGRWSLEDLVALYERALALADERGTPADQGFVRYYLGYIALDRGDIAAARTWIEESVARFGAAVQRGYALYELGWIDFTEGKPAAARGHFQAALAIVEGRTGWEIQRAHLEVGIALCDAVEGRGDAALALVGDAVEQARALGLPGILVMALVRSAEVAGIVGQPVGPELAEVLRLLRSQGDIRWVASALTMAAVVHEGRGRPDTAARLLSGAAAVAQALGENPLPLPAVAEVVASTRRRLEGALGPGGLAEAVAAGAATAVPRLLDLALDSLEG